MQSATFSGPLPPPIILHQYNEVLPGAAERIVKMAEEQAAHRREMEKTVINADKNKSYLGLIAGWSSALVFAGIGGTVLAFGNPWGVAFGAVPIAGLVWVFLSGTDKRRQEREKKSRSVGRK